ncbi:TetR/AcrR family transcriptional regulator [Asanoa sp. NPDC049518]|uniref:TetR/AcrR family transcriptional regulator n=1 Tax=unclassified Asanoa TaxID=2685164 RepID=UPI003420FF4D
MQAAEEAPRAPGRPRSLRVDEAIISATLDLLAEGTSVEVLSIEAIATRAGVGKATIYRRWPGKEALLHDALATLKSPGPEAVGESVRDDLIAMLSQVGPSNHDPRFAKIMPCIMPHLARSEEHYKAYQDIIEPRRDRIRQVLRRGVDSGELRSDLDVELILAMLIGPILVQRVLRWHPDLDADKMPEQVVDVLLAAMAPQK